MSIPTGFTASLFSGVQMYPGTPVVPAPNPASGRSYTYQARLKPRVIDQPIVMAQPVAKIVDGVGRAELGGLVTRGVANGKVSLIQNNNRLLLLI